MKTFTFLFTLLFIFSSAFSQLENQGIKGVAGELTFIGSSQPVHSLEPFPFPERHDFERNEELKERFYDFAETALPKGPDPARQNFMGTKTMSKGLTVSFNGITNNGLPPDPNGDVNTSYYYQTVNTSYQIFDKNGSTVYGPADIRNFWGTTEGVSDPVILWDDNVERWFISIFTTTPSGGPYTLHMAISQSSDPLGSYWLYSLPGMTSLPDFTKFGIWRDGYYMSANTGANDVYVFERDQMLIGGSVHYFSFDNSWRPNSGFHCIMPLDNDGAYAPTGTPGQFITINDDAWGGSDEIWIYELDVDWTGLTANFNRTQQLSVSSFDSNFGPTWDNIAQQGTTQELDAVPQVLNFRAQYRNFGSYQTIVCNHSVDVDNTDHAGVRWYELRKTSGSWYIRQQSTYAPDGHSRWMGAIAMNAYGDIGLGYSVSSSSLYPGLRYTGRHASDPLGVMTFAEQTIWDGTASQTYSNRWGDYFSMSVDPSDNRTFWFTGEYHTTSRRTRIAAINFGVYCAASGGCDEYISNVAIGSIYHSSSCTQYGDYTALSTDIPLNGVETLTVTNGAYPYYASDQCAVWVDWNNDGDFYDANETIPGIAGTPGAGPYTVDIIPPAGLTVGPRTMRIRIQYTDPPTPEPCGDTYYGEVEDYTINLTPKVPAEWTGAVNNDWHNAGNWTTPTVPDATVDVIIPDVSNKCWVYAGTAYCKNITVEAGTVYNLRIYDEELHVYGNMDIHGKLLMDQVDGVLRVEGNITWHAGSTASIQANTVMWIYGDWNFNNGANVQLTDGIVDFTGSGGSFIRSYDSNCYFNNIGVYKGGGDYVSISNLSTEDLYIHGSIYIQPNDVMYMVTPYNVFLQGDLFCAGQFLGNDGTLIMDGNTQVIYENLSYATTLYIKNLTINSTNSTSISNKDLEINGDLVIESGQFITNNHNISIEGNWDNQVGPAGFAEGTAWVIFDGAESADIINSETFYNLRLNKTYSNFDALELSTGITVDVLNELSLDDGALEMNNSSIIRVDGDLFIALEAGLNANDGYNEIEVGGNWTNENSFYNITQGFNIGGEIVTFNGSTDQILLTNAPQEEFTNIIIDKSAGYFRSNNDITIYGGLQILNGSWWDNTGGLNHKLYGNFYVASGGGYYPNAVTHFVGDFDQFFENDGGTTKFHGIIVNKSPSTKKQSKKKEPENKYIYEPKAPKSSTLSLQSMMVNFDGYTTTIEEGVFFLNGNSFKSTGEIFINDGGEMIVNDNAQLSIVTALYVNSGGVLTTIGSPGNFATVFKDVAGYYGLEVNSGGLISSNHTIFSKTNENGIWVKLGATVDPANAFNNCIFLSGVNSYFSARLVLNNTQNLTINNVEFHDNPYSADVFNIGKLETSGDIYVQNFAGDFAGEDYEYDLYNLIHWIRQLNTLELIVFLEGPFNGITMDATVNSMLPLSHPFNPTLPYFGNPMPDWYYTGPGSVGAIPNSSVVDWVMVEIRDAPNAGSAFPATIVAQKPAFLLTDGHVVELNGSSDLEFDVPIFDGLFVAVKHKDHVGVISTDPIPISGGFAYYDFSSGMNQAHGGGAAHKQLASGIWGMFSGDGDGDGEVNMFDHNNVWSVQAGQHGYLESDFNMDGQTNNPDKDEYWLPNLGQGSFIPE